MTPKRFFGLALVLVAVIAALVLDHAGRDHQVRDYTIDFVRGTELSREGEGQIEHIAAAMVRQPAYTAVVTGHTGTRGSPTANRALGSERAGTVTDRLTRTGIARDRIETFSAGGEEPLPRGDDEGERGFQSRLSRVEVRLNP